MVRLNVTVLGILLVCAVIAAALWIFPGCTRNEQSPVSSATPPTIAKSPALTSTITGAGNGSPNGPHYNLNIIGVPKGKSADMTGSDGHVIFVSLSGNTKILLSVGPFQVLDANGTDGSASFQLPRPDSLNTGTTTYSVWARALGKPGGKANMYTCGADEFGEVYCSVDTLHLARNRGKSTFTDVSRYLLYIYADINADGILERVPLFDSRLQDYFWAYDNFGLKLVQLRFYPIPTTVPAAQ